MTPRQGKRTALGRVTIPLSLLYIPLLYVTATTTSNTPLRSGFSSSLSTRLFMANPATSYQAQVEKTQYRGWAVYRLTNGIVSLYVAPDIGGRAIQMRLGDQEFFFVNQDLAGKVLP